MLCLLVTLTIVSVEWREVHREVELLKRKCKESFNIENIDQSFKKFCSNRKQRKGAMVISVVVFLIFFYF